MQLVLDTKGLTLTAKNNSFFVSDGGRERLIGPKKITSIAVTAGCLISSQAMMLAARNGIPVLFFDRRGRPEARLWSPYFSSLADLRRRQVLFTASAAATDWLAGLFGDKLERKVANLQWLKNRRPSLAGELDKAQGQMRSIAEGFGAFQGQVPADCGGQLMGVEGSMARVYWQVVADSVPEPLPFKGRSRQPAEDAFNAALNYLYGMMYPVVEGALFAAGLDPHLGVLHADQYDAPTLAFDLIEPFRPWADRLLLEACLQGQVDTATFFENKDGGVFLAKPGKRFFIPLFNDFMETVSQHGGKRLSNRNHIYRYAQEFANKLKENGKW